MQRAEMHVCSALLVVTWRCPPGGPGDARASLHLPLCTRTLAWLAAGIVPHYALSLAYGHDAAALIITLIGTANTTHLQCCQTWCQLAGALHLCLCLYR